MEEGRTLADYEILRDIKDKVKGSLMSGSGSTFFVLEPSLNASFDDNFDVFENLKTIQNGVEEVL